MATSRLENALYAIQDEFQEITTANGYRNDLIGTQVLLSIRHPSVITTFPEVGIECFDELTEPFTEGRNLYTSACDIRVSGRVKPYTDLTNEATKLNEALESLAHDFRRVIDVMSYKYYADAVSPWILKDGSFRIQRNRIVNLKMGFAELVCTFQIMLRNVDGTFS
jgi:hypothetical protein